MRKLAFHAESNYFYFDFHAVGKECLVLQAVALPTETHGIIQWQFEHVALSSQHQFLASPQLDVGSSAVKDHPVTLVEESCN